MKKILSGITAMLLVVGLSTTGVQAKEPAKQTEMTKEQVVQMVEQADREIYNEIEKAVVKANNLVGWYQTALSIVPESKDTEMTIKHIETVSKDLKALASVYGSYSDSEQLLKNISSLTVKAESLKSSIDYSYVANVYTEMVNRIFNAELDKIILDLVNTTNKIAADVTRKAERNGYTIESTWIEVQIGNRTVLVDPCRVIDF